MYKIRHLIVNLLLTILVLCASTVHAESFTATAYDLSPGSCGKSRDHWAYGITASGYNLKGHTWESARTVAADTSVFSLGTQLYIKFPEPYEHMNGIYTVRDTGGGVSGYHIDIFFGEDAHEEAIQFGKRSVYVSRL